MPVDNWDKPVSDTGKELPSDPGLAQRTAHLSCPRCGCDIYQDAPLGNMKTKEWMNERGVFVAPGQHVDRDGIVHGEPPDATTISFWVSGLASPFKSWGDRAERYVTAVRGGDTDAIQAVINGGFGELYSPGGGNVPDWHEVAKLRSDTYMLGQVPSWVKLATLTADVQKNGIYYTVRGWGAKARSTLIDHGFLQGETADEAVWDTLSEMLEETYDGLPIRLALVDSGFRPGKKDELPLNRIYEFARKHKRVVRATKGSSTAMARPIISSPIDVNRNGDILPNALELYRHSKWLAFMERRLLVARELLNPDDSVLIVTIDEKEYLRLGLLLEQTFPEARLQMISTSINPAAQARTGSFARIDEYVLVAMLGEAGPSRLPLGREWVSARGRTHTGNARWDLLRRSGTAAQRKDSPGGFYAIYVDPSSNSVAEVGEPLPKGISDAQAGPPGTVAVLPIRRDGSEGRWQVSPATLRQYRAQGRVKVGGSPERGFTVYYLKPGEWSKVQTGEYESLGIGPEAHRGMRESTRSGTEGRQTIVKQFINGAGSVPGIPVVWGISATVERFNEAIKGMQGRSTLPPVEVDATKVQGSGLLKDTINLDIPDEAGNFETVLVRRGTDKLKEISAAWAAYAKKQGDAHPVLPLMVLQVPNSPDPNDIGKWLDTVFERWPQLPADSVANVFGDHQEETFGRWTAPYIEPQRVQQTPRVRILVAKDAISTGWDCPRAEVMVSFRPARDRTHITQLLGRMVRTPLARRIPGNDRLNAVDCLLPHFDKKSVEAVVTALMTGADNGEALQGRRVLVNPIEVKPNKTIPEEVWQALEALPSQTLPRKQARPIKRLTILAHELAADGLVPDAGKKAHAELHKVLDGLRVRYATEIREARQNVLQVEGKSVKADVKTGGMSFNDFIEAADYTVIEDAYRRAGKVISPDVARTYAEHLAAQAGGGTEDGLMDAHEVVAALGLVSAIKGDLEAEAEKLAHNWLNDQRVATKALTDARQDVYREIREMSADPLPVDIARPSVWLQATTVRSADGSESPLERYERHLLSDDQGLYPAEMGGWEVDVLKTELARPGNVGWYRNPARGSQDSLGIVYDDGVRSKLVRPDFIFFSRMADGRIVADIVDPHGTHLSDALPKLKGLAAYAEANASCVRRVEGVALIAGKYRVLDLTEQSVRDRLGKASSAEEIYASELATDFDLQSQ